MTESQDWQSEIAKGVIIQQQIRDLNSHMLWEHHLPRVAATEAEIAGAEVVVGHPLDPGYRRFLGYADGWVNFYQTVAVFGTPELVGGRLHEVAAEELGALVEAGVLASLGLSPAEVQPIAASEEQEDLFVVCGPESSRPGHVLWLAGELIDDYPDFDHYFSAMLDFQMEERDELRGATGCA